MQNENWDRLYHLPNIENFKIMREGEKNSTEGKLGDFGRNPEEFPVQWECHAKKRVGGEGGGSASRRGGRGGFALHHSHSQNNDGTITGCRRRETTLAPRSISPAIIDAALGSRGSPNPAVIG